MSERIRHILDVIKYVKDNWAGGNISGMRRSADKLISKKYHVKDRTIVDKYRRQLKDKHGNDLGTENFDRLVQKWLQEKDQELKAIIIEHCVDPSDRKMVMDFFEEFNGPAIQQREVKPREREYWIFQTNPEYYDLKGALKLLKEQNWLVVQHKDRIRKGDAVYIWQSGPSSGIYAIAEVLTNPGPLPENPAERPFVKTPEKFEGEKPRVRLSINRVLQKPVSKSLLLKIPEIANLKIISAAQGTNFSLTPEQAHLIDQLIDAPVEPNIWWVNQGTTLQAEVQGGFLWAPFKSKSGRSMSHWDTMAEVNQHDIIVHYANGALRYVSKVLQAAIETTKPATLKEEDWSTDGRMVKVEYHELTPQIPIKKISEATLQLDISQGPINSSGGVKQGYLFRLTPDALGIIQNSQPETKWPDFAIMPKTPPVIKNPEYPLLQVALETSFPEDQLAHWVHAIERKGQAIVYGPPGTGKTYIAEKLALHLIGGGDGFQEVVQFHPAYSYEDFIQGIRPKARPDGSLDYPVVAGRFLEFCDRSKSRQGRCVLIIDEINRANLSQVFGELMYLLEYRNREVPLASGGIFQIPTNIRLIGTMNTADRSIALVDHALRRRFAFLRLYPNYEVLSKYHANTGFPVENLIQTLRHLNNQIGDPHYEVGISFFLRKDLESQIEDIWGMEIEPYLEEYFFDQPEKVGEFRWQKVHKKIFP